MIDKRDASDAMLDQNLRRVGQILLLPEPPSASQRARWKCPSSESTSTLRIWRRPGLFAALGSGLAAAILLCAIYVVPASSSQIVASTIFQSLRDVPRRGLHVRLDGVRIDDLSVTSTLQAAFPQPVTLDQLLRLRDLPRPEQLYVRLSLQAGPRQRDVAGLDMDVEASFRDGDSWGFVRVSKLPRRLADRTPLLAGAAAFLRTGLLIDLTGLEDLLDSDDSNHQTSLDLVSRAPRALEERWNREQGPRDNEGRIDGLLRGLVTGTLDGEQLPLMVNELERLAGNAQVRSRGPGEYVLTAARFRFANPDAEDAKLLSRAVLTIVYREGAGVDALELAHVGDGDGSIHFSFIDRVEDTLSNRDRFAADGARQVSLDAAIRLFLHGVRTP